jgi:hypothetical protein
LLPLPEYPITNPIFLLGTQGGGLTLLSRMLRRHHKVISVTGNVSYWSGADELANVYGLILPPQFTGMRFKYAPHPVLTGPRSWSYACDDLLETYRQRAADATEELKLAFIGLIRLSARRFARDKSDYRFLDKSQTAAVRVGLYYKLLEEFDPKFVVMTREPYVSVYRAATGKAGDMQRYKKNKVLSDHQRIRICSEHLGNSMRAIYEDADELGIQLHISQFEQLLEDPERTLRSVCEFVDIEFNPDMLPSPRHRLPVGSRFPDRWYPLRTEVNEQYEKQLTAQVIEVVNKHCAEIIPRIGYPLR